MEQEKFLLALRKDHRGALELCRLIREETQAVPDNGDKKSLLDLSLKTAGFLRDKLETHCEAEERILRIYGRHVGENDPGIRRLREDHSRLKALALDGSLEGMSRLSECLAAHIHFEESFLYPLLEKTLATDEKKAVAFFLERG